MLKGYVHSLESFGSVDGPGVRYVIFLSGCAMRCQFCHNPDTWNMTDGKEYTTDQLLKTALRFKSYWGDKGGITVSGGEPLLQMDFLTELFRKAKEAGVHTTLDTSGNPYTTKEPWHSKWLELMKYTDILLLVFIMSGNDNFHLLPLCITDKIPRCFVEEIPQVCLPSPAECMEPFGLFLRMSAITAFCDLREKSGSLFVEVLVH